MWKKWIEWVWEIMKIFILMKIWHALKLCLGIFFISQCESLNEIVTKSIYFPIKIQSYLNKSFTLNKWQNILLTFPCMYHCLTLFDAGSGGALRKPGGAPGAPLHNFGLANSYLMKLGTVVVQLFIFQKI